MASTRTTDMDFLATIGNSTLYTFHSHTEFCDGRAQMEAFAREAVKQGFTHYGFTPHSPVPFHSPCNMSADNVERYLAEVARIQREYGDRCRFYPAMDIDYIDENWGPANSYFKWLPLDYSIGSVHFIHSQEGELVDIDGHYDSFRRKMETKFHNDLRYVVETFYRQSHNMLSEGGFDIIGHLDKIGHNASHHHPGIEDEAWYQALVNDLIDHVIESGVTVEINTKAYADHQGRLFPARRHIPRLLAAGVPVIVNSDAHVPALINASRNIGLDLLH